MPPTTGGSTIGSSTTERTSPCPRKLVRASTSAIGTPNSRHRTVASKDVRRLNDSAVSAESEVTSSKKLPHSTRDTIPTSGSSTRAAPSAAGTKIQAGSPTCRCLVATSLRLPEAGIGEDLLACVAEHEVDELVGEVLGVGSLDGCDRVGVHDVARLREGHPGDGVTGGGHVGHVDDPRVGLAGRHLGEHVGHRLLLAHRLQRHAQVAVDELVHGRGVGGGEDVRRCALLDLGDQVGGAAEVELDLHVLVLGLELLADLLEGGGQRRGGVHRQRGGAAAAAAVCVAAAGRQWEGEGEDGEQGALHGRSTTTLVDLTEAMARTPGCRPSSSAASALISETIR